MLEAMERVGDDGEASRESVYVCDGEVVGKGDGDIKHWSSLLALEQDGDAFKWEEVSTEVILLHFLLFRVVGRRLSASRMFCYAQYLGSLQFRPCIGARGEESQRPVRGLQRR
jgi:hypothetical protein